MRLESALAINLRIGIAVLAGACADLLSRHMAEKDFQGSVSIGLTVTAGVLIVSYALVPARPKRP